jgi:hypothetical protein
MADFDEIKVLARDAKAVTSGIAARLDARPP